MVVRAGAAVDARDRIAYTDVEEEPSETREHLVNRSAMDMITPSTGSEIPQKVVAVGSGHACASHLHSGRCLRGTCVN